MLQTAFSTKNRFSLLLLEDNEYYFEDCIALYRPAPTKGTPESFPERGIPGKLKICSRSLVFDPDDTRMPVFRLPFKAVPSGTTASEVSGSKNKSFTLSCARTIRCKELGRDHPYKTVDCNPTNMVHTFELLYVTTSTILPFICNLIRLFAEKNESALSQLISSREQAISFDATWLEDLREHVSLEATCKWVTAASDLPGRLCITNKRIYFQPFNNATGQVVHKFDRSHLRMAIKRRFNLRHTAVELFFSSNSVLLAFPTVSMRDAVSSELKSVVVDSQSPVLQKMADLWSNGEISNFDYLLFLNFVAGRSFHDLAQYPVFPWVLRSYTSPDLDLSNPAVYRDLTKPIGALSQSRISVLLERYEVMKETGQTPFLYGTHYSTPAYVMFFCVRAAPAVLLHLQSGRYDAPDRMFASIAETWESVLANPADVKELIPEFYMPSMAERFLYNQMGLNLGTRQNGQQLNDVVLPPWAKNGRHCAQVMRQALESDVVSKQLHHWIDLIFGYKQSGENARQALNVFHPLTYDAAIREADARITDPNERASVEAQVREFGQCPLPLFKRPHAAKRVMSKVGSSPGEMGDDLRVLNILASLYDNNSSGMSGSGVPAPLSLPTSSSGSFTFGSGSTGSAANTPASVSNYGNSGSNVSLNMDSSSSSFSSSSSSSSGASISTSMQNNTNNSAASFSSSSSTSSLATPTSASGGAGSSTLNVLKPSAHALARVHRDAVTDLRLSSSDARTVYTTSRDGSLRLIERLSGRQLRAVSQFAASSSGLALSALRVGRDAQTIYVASWAGDIFAYAPDYGKVSSTLRGHDDAVSAIALVQDDKSLISGSWDATVRWWDTRTCQLVRTAEEHDAAVHAVDASLDGSLVVSGTADGAVHLWDVRTGHSINHWAVGTSGTSVRLAVAGSGQSLVAACEGESVVRYYDMRKSSSSAALMHEMNTTDASAMSVGCVRTDGRTVWAGYAEGILATYDAQLGVVAGEHRVADAVGITCLDWHEGSKVALVGCDDGSVYSCERVRSS